LEVYKPELLRTVINYDKENRTNTNKLSGGEATEQKERSGRVWKLLYTAIP
jgi:hypothetical protein